MNRAIRYGTAIVLVRLLVNIVHGLTHRELHIELDLAAMLFVIMLCPLLAMGLLWTNKRRLGLILLAFSMTGSFLFGLYNHFVAIGLDHVGKQASGPWKTTFCSYRSLSRLYFWPQSPRVPEWQEWPGGRSQQKSSGASPARNFHSANCCGNPSP